MSILRGLRRIWHDAYYALAPKSAVSYALRCREFVERVDTHQFGTTRSERLRYKLHSSLCQACRNYERYTQWIRRESQPLAKSTQSDQLENLNQRLLQKFSKKD